MPVAVVPTAVSVAVATVPIAATAAVAAVPVAVAIAPVNTVPVPTVPMEMTARNTVRRTNRSAHGNTPIK